jgi:hypothetical protein
LGPALLSKRKKRRKIDDYVGGLDPCGLSGFPRLIPMWTVSAQTRGWSEEKKFLIFISIS